MLINKSSGKDVVFKVIELSTQEASNTVVLNLTESGMSLYALPLPAPKPLSTDHFYVTPYTSVVDDFASSITISRYPNCLKNPVTGEWQKEFSKSKLDIKNVWC